MEDMQTWWPLTAHPGVGVGAVLPGPWAVPLLLVWILAALVPVSLHHIQIQNSTFSVVPAKISVRWRMWFFLFLFFTEDVLRHRGGDHITKNAPSTISWGPRAVLQVTPLFKPMTPSVHEALGGPSSALAASFLQEDQPTKPSVSPAFSHLSPKILINPISLSYYSCCLVAQSCPTLWLCEL